MPLDPTLDELSGQQSKSPGLPPPQPVPYGVARAQEHQQQWGGSAGMPGFEAQLSEVAKQVQNFSTSGLTGVFPSLRQTMPGWVNSIGDLVQSPAARDALSTANIGGIPLLGALRMIRKPDTDFFNTHGAKDNFKLISKETGNEMGRLHTTYNSKNQNLEIKYMGSLVESGKFDKSRPWNTHWGMGTHEIETLGPEILNEYPDVKTISFIRLPGIKDAAGQPMAERTPRAMKFAVVRTPDGGMTLELIESKKIPSPSSLSSSSPSPSSPEPPSSPELPASTESWEDMRRRQNEEWRILMNRLFGER